MKALSTGSFFSRNKLSATAEHLEKQYKSKNNMIIFYYDCQNHVYFLSTMKFSFKRRKWLREP